MPSPTHIIGLDIGGTKTAVVLGDDGGRIHDRVDFATNPTRGFEPTFADICDGIDTIRTRAVAGGTAPDCISVSIGGPMDAERGVIHSPPNLPGWTDIPLKDMLADRFKLPIHVEHDGTAGALAEWYFGAAVGARDVIFLTMGTGFGGGLILNGLPYRGASNLAGEVGHIRLAEAGPTAFGKVGSWEAFCSGTGIVRLAAHCFPDRWRDHRTTVRELADMASTGDDDAMTVLAEAGRFLGRGLAVLLDTLNPEIIVIGSLAVRLGDLVLAPAREELAREALPGAVSACRVVPAALGEKLGDVASLCAAIAAQRRPASTT